ncbi:hypothetical protein WK09_04565 [Burkholderia ubonensis]|nr:hypothetical protein WK09_04565 [Burkholderia ubonensis]
MNQISRWLAIVASRQDIALAVLLLVAVFMMIVPLPTALVDLMIAFNLMIAIILLMMSLYIRDPLEFAAFPSVLLITTLYRLALTISTTRLILLQADAGEFVYTFGSFAVGGNLGVGLIVFVIVTIVQFIVITKGSERVAEVSARFSLDGMPGKQMSIDADLKAGIVDAEGAKERRMPTSTPRTVARFVQSRLRNALHGALSDTLLPCAKRDVEFYARRGTLLRLSTRANQGYSEIGGTVRWPPFRPHEEYRAVDRIRAGDASQFPADLYDGQSGAREGASSGA